jgi:hypothetical protein
MNIIGLLLIISTLLLSPVCQANGASEASEKPEKEVWIYPQIGVSLPQPLTVGIEAFRTNAENIKIFIDTGYFQYPFSSSPRTFKEFSVNAGVRYYPFNNWFYTSGALGYRWLSYSLSDISALRGIDGEILANALGIHLTTFYTSIAFGFNVHVSSRVIFGFEIGAQLPIMGSAAQEIQTSSGTTTTGAEGFSRIARFPIPQITLFRLSWMLD